MDISNFMSWFISQVVSIFTFAFGVLDNIQFAGTSLLKVLIIISILIPLVAIFLTIAPNTDISSVRGYRAGRREKVIDRNKKVSQRRIQVNRSTGGKWI